MPKFGVIQNEEVLQEVLRDESEFFIPCMNKADAHSKAVSLSNAKNRLPIFQQKKLRVQRVEVDGEWGVKVFPASKIVVWKLVDGEKTLWDPNEGKLSEEDQRQFNFMVDSHESLENIISCLSEGKEGVIRKLYEQLKKGELNA